MQFSRCWMLACIGASATLAGAFVAVPAVAQENDAKSTSRYALEEITVTARKVEEGLQKAPIAVTAMSGLELENRGALDVVDFADVAPNVSLKNDGTISGFAAAPRTSIRGVGQSDFVINTDPAVGMYADGVYLGRSIGSIMDLVDVERVEALRGPQGTLFGRNSTGGAINIIAKKPEIGSPASGYLTAGFGEEGYLLVRGSANIPLGDSAAARLTVLKRERDGYIPAVQYNDLELGEEDVTGFRAAFRWQPNDSVTLDLDADFSSRDDTPAPLVPVLLGDLSVGETDLDISGAGAQRPGISTSLMARRYNGEAPTGPPIPADYAALGYVTTDSQCGSDAAYRDSSLTCLGNAWAGSRNGTNMAWFDQEGGLIRPNQELDTYGYSARLTWATDSITLKSITAWRGFDSSFLNGSPAPIYLGTNDNQKFDQDQFSQEFNVDGSIGDRVRWLGGVFYQEEDGVETVLTVYPLVPPAANNDRDFLPINGIEDRNIDNTSKAIFGQLSFDLSDAVELTVGARRTDEEKYVFIEKIENEAGVISEVLEDTANIEETSFLVNLSWVLNDDTMIYGQFSDGFRNGGFPSRVPPGSGLDFEEVQYGPEYVDTLEFGVKATSLDGRLRTNFAVFSSDYTDMQINATVFDPVNSVNVSTVQNIGDSEISGAELEANFLVSDNFRLDASIGYLDTELKTINADNGQFIVNNNNNLQKIITADSNVELPHAPELQANIGANFSFFLGNNAEIRNRIDVLYESDQFASIANYNLDKIDSTTRINYIVSYIPESGSWELTLGARNLTDEEDVLNVIADTGPRVGLYHVLGRGREAFVQYKHSFGE